MSDTHAARPTDLVALVTFDDQVRENLAVTWERLGGPPQAPRPLSAAIKQWLHRGRQTWITVRGRQVQGIATARVLSRSTWQIDALIDASEHGDGDVFADLLRQAALAARDARIALVLLRTPAGAPSVDAALRAGYRQALHERLWTGRLWAGQACTHPDLAGGSPEVREARPADAFPLFQLYSRATPLEARSALAMTFEEWQSTRERRWCARGTELVAVDGNRLTGMARVAERHARGQVELLVESEGAEARAAAAALVEAAGDRIGFGYPVLSLVRSGSTVAEAALSEHGLQPGAEYVVLSCRLARPVREHAPARAGIAIPTSG